MVTLDPRLKDMAISIARAFRRRLPPNVLVEDLEQAALIGLLDGLSRHPQGGGEAYEWYLRRRISGSILDELRAQDWSPRRRKRTLPPIVHLEDLPLWADIMAGASVDAEEEAILRLDAAKAWATPIDKTDHHILVQRYRRGIKQDAVAAALKLSPPRISQREQRGLLQMRRHLEGP